MTPVLNIIYYHHAKMQLMYDIIAHMYDIIVKYVNNKLTELTVIMTQATTCSQIEKKKKI